MSLRGATAWEGLLVPEVQHVNVACLHGISSSMVCTSQQEPQAKFRLLICVIKRPFTVCCVVDCLLACGMQASKHHRRHMVCRHIFSVDPAALHHQPGSLACCDAWLPRPFVSRSLVCVCVVWWVIGFDVVWGLRFHL